MARPPRSFNWDDIDALYDDVDKPEPHDWADVCVLVALMISFGTLLFFLLS